MEFRQKNGLWRLRGPALTCNSYIEFKRTVRIIKMPKGKTN